MPSRDIADMPEFCTLAQALEEYCIEAGISEDSPERKALAMRVTELFASGHKTVGDLKRGLADSRQPQVGAPLFPSTSSR